MIRKSTWITLGVFVIVLIAGLYITKYVKTPEPEITVTPTPFELAVPGGSVNNLVEITFIDHGTPSLKIMKAVDGAWSFDSSSQTPINQARVSEILSNISSLQVQTKLSKSSNTQDLGLSPAMQEIDLVNSDEHTIRLLIGSPTPTQSGYYFQVDESIPVIVSKGGLETLIGLLTEENLKIQDTATP